MDHQNMSEHVLCMVLYLIELGLDNQVQDNKEDEVCFIVIARNTLVVLQQYCLIVPDLYSK